MAPCTLTQAAVEAGLWRRRMLGPGLSSLLPNIVTVQLLLLVQSCRLELDQIRMWKVMLLLLTDINLQSREQIRSKTAGLLA